MRQVTHLPIMAWAALPPPPGIPERGDGNGSLMAVPIAAIILGIVVLIAWLLKPLAARRLAEEESAAPDAEPEAGEPFSARWNEAWSPKRGDAGISPRMPEAELVPESPTGEIVAAEEDDVTTGTIAGITLTVRELLENANTGQLLRGFALYSEPYLQRFRAETGLSEEEFKQAFGEASAPPPEARAELAAVTDVEELPDGRVSALITYANGGSSPPPERFIFVHSTGDRWLIDDIATVG
ncbi:MAG: hypothetical protein QOF01_776 [Thermomicrobiales bacterium]|jgi:hypothetical protein|nr:hypothetical protein [Thermomicrobiales bacterium]